MNPIKFIESFQNGSLCSFKFKELRDEQEVICRKCESKDHYLVKHFLSGLQVKSPCNKE